MQPAGRETNFLGAKGVGFRAAFSILTGCPGSRHGGNMGHRRSWSRLSPWVRAGAAVLGMLLCGCWCPWCPLVSSHHGVLPWLMHPPAPCFSLPLPHICPPPQVAGTWLMVSSPAHACSSPHLGPHTTCLYPAHAPSQGTVTTYAMNFHSPWRYFLGLPRGPEGKGQKLIIFL